MEYTPEVIVSLSIPEKNTSEIGTLTGPALIRGLAVDRFEEHGLDLWLFITNISQPLAIPFDRKMRFGTETITAKDYFLQVIESGDLIDAVVHPLHDGVFPISIYWIHIQYVGTPQQAGNFQKKDDGLFAMWAKAGEKAERVVARSLRDKFGHSFADDRYTSPGYFEIRYVLKKQRQPDMTCLVCKFTLESKKRNKDKNFRVSHSEGRPFCNENKPNDWHAFVFADMQPRFMPNSAILQAINEGRFTPGHNEWDKWADVHGVEPENPPHCKSR